MAVKEEVKPFQLVAGHVALDLVNTLDMRFTEPVELLEGYADVVRFAEQAGVLERTSMVRLRAAARKEVAAAERVLRQVQGLREALAAVLYAMVDGGNVPAAEVGALERFFKQAGQNRMLMVEQADDTIRGLTWGWPNDATELSLPLWMLAIKADRLMTSGDVSLMRTCDADTCRWLFLDTSKNHKRRWCDMKICGNRMKARRFHARQSGGGN